MKITELKGKSHVFTLKDGKTLRIFAHDTKKIADSKVSNELKIAESMGLILLMEDSTEVPKTNKKSGGTK
jgi:hypothetical protein